jgi:hypothetical protein
MIRDKLKKKEYFDKWLSFDLEDGMKRQERIDSNAIPTISGKVFAANDLCEKAIDRCVMRYSRGDALSNFRDDVEDILAKREQLRSLCDSLPLNEQKDRVQYERLSFDNYLDFFWWLSLAVCMGMNQAHIARVLASIDNSGKDALLDRIAIMLGDDQRIVGSELVFPKQYALLLQVLDASSDERPKLVKKFLDGWYKGNRNKAPWYDNHKGEDTGYIGYWCFEAALVVKLLEIDDSTFREHMHYPADLIRSI